MAKFTRRGGVAALMALVDILGHRTSFNLRCDYAASARVSTWIAVEKFDEVDVAAEI